MSAQGLNAQRLSPELKDRVLWGAILAALVLITVFVLGAEAVYLVGTVCAILGWREYARMMDLKSRPAFHWMGYFFMVAMLTHFFFLSQPTLVWMWLGWMLAFVSMFFERWTEPVLRAVENTLAQSLREVFPKFFARGGSTANGDYVGADARARDAADAGGIFAPGPGRDWAHICRFVLGLFYVFMIFGFVGPVVATKAHGEQLLILTLAVVFLGDTAAYFVGRRYGTRKLWPDLSPKKTVEGALGGWAGSLAAAVLVWALGRVFSPPSSLNFVTCLMMGILAPPLAQAGDFLESLMKRAAGRKDSGALLPGHGGILDRTDGLVFVMPLVYYMF